MTIATAKPNALQRRLASARCCRWGGMSCQRSGRYELGGHPAAAPPRPTAPVRGTPGAAVPRRAGHVDLAAEHGRPVGEVLAATSGVEQSETRRGREALRRGDLALGDVLRLGLRVVDVETLHALLEQLTL